MNPRVDYEMSEKDLKELLEACKPVACLMIGGHTPSSPQENANMAWAKLGKKMGFDSMSVRPSNKGQRFFTAIPSETDTQKQERMQREAEEKRRSEILKLKEEIKQRQDRLEGLENE